jgi:Leucine-rich repeat (LRR) protein
MMDRQQQSQSDTNNTAVRVRQEIKQSKFSNIICLGHERLFSVPPSIASIDWIQRIRRIDLSFNAITVLPGFITDFSHLKELWVQGNPIAHFPANIEKLSHLEVLDMRNTSISSIPPELSLIKSLCSFDWRGTPAAEHYEKRYGIVPNDLAGLLSVLDNTHRRKGLEHQLLVILSEEHFAKEADKPGIKEFIVGLVNVRSHLPS